MYKFGLMILSFQEFILGFEISSVSELTASPGIYKTNGRKMEDDKYWLTEGK